MSTSPDILIFVSRDWLPSIQYSSADLSVKQMGHALECFCVSVYSYVHHSNAILYVWHTPMCVCALMSISSIIWNLIVFINSQFKLH